MVSLNLVVVVVGGVLTLVTILIYLLDFVHTRRVTLALLFAHAKPVTVRFLANAMMGNALHQNRWKTVLHAILCHLAFANLENAQMMKQIQFLQHRPSYPLLLQHLDVAAKAVLKKYWKLWLVHTLAETELTGLNHQVEVP
jgi:hypothetical protein